ncbi:Type 1 glutamine amidotransferase-like domain-containing protein [Paenibacillus thiaminolyticus]|uniref:Type 1 glutamine amidotransferase-like domain-containing protein n=1 Tax=Paenibacillus thiaminolyticus TaxID=49283 RepID=UPI0035A61C85
MKDRHLFLFGGGPPFGEELGRKFAAIASARKGKTAILFIERDGWREYMPTCTEVLERNGLTELMYLALTPQPSRTAIEQLLGCNGIVICGGETERYRSHIVDTVLGSVIQDMYRKGVPVAGFSAGALICPADCVIPAIDNASNTNLCLQGLGLLRDAVVSVHYTQWNEEENLKAAVLRTGVSIGYGLDDGTGVYFMNEELVQTEGEGLYRFARQDLQS